MYETELKLKVKNCDVFVNILFLNNARTSVLHNTVLHRVIMHFMQSNFRIMDLKGTLEKIVKKKGFYKENRDNMIQPMEFCNGDLE